MSSRSRINASRANGALSHGPKTPEGRARSDAAPITHGLNARRTVLAHESEENFRALREGYIIQFQPESLVDWDLLDEFVAVRWRLLRITGIETAMVDLEVEKQEPQVAKKYAVCDTETRSALAYRALYEDSRALTALGRHEARIRRTHDRLIKQLKADFEERKNRKVQQEPNPNNEHPALTPLTGSDAHPPSKPPEAGTPCNDTTSKIPAAAPRRPPAPIRVHSPSFVAPTLFRLPYNRSRYVCGPASAPTPAHRDFSRPAPTTSQEETRPR